MAIKQQPGHRVSKRMLYKHLPADEWVSAAILLTDDKFDKVILFWQYIDSIEGSVKISLRHILAAVDFVVINNRPLDSAVNHVKKALEQGSFNASPLPSVLKSWVPKRYHLHIFYDNKVIHNRFEFLLYMQIAHHMSTDKLILKYTAKYKRIENYCYQKPIWQKEKASILRKLEQPKLQAPIRNTISHKKKSLDQLFMEVNKSILSGANDAVKVIHHQDGRKRPAKQNSWRRRGYY